ncbi:MAG: LicD family protein [Candidatus Bathyarchaeia archaeon]
MWEKYALKNLRDVKQIFDAYNIKFWLDYGTLLGAIRDGKLIEHMQDIDLGMMDEDWEKFLNSIRELNKRAFDVVISEFKMDEVIFRTAKLCRFYVNVDLSVYKILGEYAIDIHGSWGNRKLKFVRSLYYILPIPNSIRSIVKNTDSKPLKFFDIFPSKSKMHAGHIVRWLLGWKSYYYNKIPKYYFMKLDKIELHGEKFNVPSPPRGYLAYLYGRDWKVPQKNWNFVDNGSFYPLIVPNRIESVQTFSEMKNYLSDSESRTCGSHYPLSHVSS